jgi:serine/threonine protein kinase
MALEWLTGETLDDDLERRRGLGGRTPRECLEIVRPVLSALALVHAAGVAHRDLKPANIMLFPSPVGVTPKLLDFGIAKVMDGDESPGSGQTQTRSTQTAFSPAYASPEQISHGRSGPWTDVHAVGLILTELLTDRPPIAGEEPALLFQQIVDRVRPTPAKFGAAVGAWEAVIARALAVLPAERYRNAGELLQALDETVGQALAARATAPHEVFSSSGAMSAGVATALGLSSTEASPPSVDRTRRSHVTTHSPTSDSEPTLAPRRSLVPSFYIAGGAVVLTVVLGVSWHATRTESSNTPAVGLAPPPTASPTPPPPSSSSAAPSASTATAPSASTLATVSTSPTGSTSPPTAAPATAAALRPPPRASSSAPPAVPPAAPTTPAPSGKIILE